MEQVTALTQLVRQALRGRLDVFALDNKVSYQDGQTYTILTAVNGIEEHSPKPYLNQYF